ncbi:hypothetical protein [Actinocrispum wychmicini]
MQFAHVSAHPLQAQVAWLQVGHTQSAQEQTAHESEQCGHAHTSHSS